MELINKKEFIALHKGYFFSISNNNFFKRRISKYGYKNLKNNVIYFVTSEVIDEQLRRYTVRSIDKNGIVREEYRNIMPFKTNKQAHRAALKIANN